MAESELTGRERQALAVLSDYIVEYHYDIQWGIAIDHSGSDFDWEKHYRLTRAQSWQDPDYPTAINRSLQDIYSGDKNALRALFAHIFDGKVPEQQEVIQAFQNLGLIEGEERDIVTSLEPPMVLGRRALEIDPTFSRREFHLDPNLVFMLMPFQPSFNRIYENHIKPTIEGLGLQIMKADDIFNPGPIMEDIWEYINNSRFIIADVTGRNPNVFYELGIAHTIGKDVIIITQKEQDVPFDLLHLRYFGYTDNEAGWEQLKNNLQRVTKSII